MKRAVARWMLATMFVVAAMATNVQADNDLALYQANGVKIGEVTQTTAIIWTRLTGEPEMLKGIPFAAKGAMNPDAPKNSPASQLPPGKKLSDMEGYVAGAAGEVRVTYRVDTAKAKPSSTKWEAVDVDGNSTRQFRLKGLKPGTKYALAVESRVKEGGAKGQTATGRFRTAPAPDQPATVKLMVVTGQDYPRRDTPEGHQIYTHMLAQDPDFFVHTGDIEYYDKPGPLAFDVETARFKWNRVYALPLQRKFHNNVAAYFIKDDHDTLKNDAWPGQTYGELTWDQGIALFPEQVPMGDRTYRTVRWGKDLQVWFVEGRDYRSANTAKDGPNKTIWGKEQKEWFKRTVRESDATFRLLISPTPLVGPDRGGKNDNHANAGFTHEGDELREFIAAQGNMLTTCGDRHWQYVSIHDPSGVTEFSCGPTSNKHAGGWSNNNRSDMHQYLNVQGGFLCITVERKNGKPTLTGRHYNVQGELSNEHEFVAK